MEDKITNCGAIRFSGEASKRLGWVLKEQLAGTVCRAVFADGTVKDIHLEAERVVDRIIPDGCWIAQDWNEDQEEHGEMYLIDLYGEIEDARHVVDLTLY